MKKELNVEEFLEKIKDDSFDIDDYFSNELKTDDELLILKKIEENFTIKQQDKYKLIKALEDYKNDEERATSISIYIAGLFEKDEISKIVSDDNIFSELDEYSKTYLISKNDNIDKYLTKEEKDEIEPGLLIKLTEKNVNDFTIEQLIDLGLAGSNIFKEKLKMTGEIEKYLTAEKIQEYKLNSTQIKELVEATGEIGKYLTAEKIQELGLDDYQILNLIKATGEIEKYLTAEKIQELGLKNYQILNLIKATGNIDKYLTAEKIKGFGLNNRDKENLVIDLMNTNKDKYLTVSTIKECEITPSMLKYLLDDKKVSPKLIEASLENVRVESQMSNLTIKNILRCASKPYDYLENKKIVEEINSIFPDEAHVIFKTIIAETKMQDKYFEEPQKCKDVFKQGPEDIGDLICASENKERYLQKEYVIKLGITPQILERILNENENDNKNYITLEIIETALNNCITLKTAETIGPTELNAKRFEEAKSLENLMIKLNLECTPKIIDYIRKADANRVKDILLKGKNPEKYLTGDFELNPEEIAALIKKSQNKKKYLSLENIKKFKLEGKDICSICNISDITFQKEIDEEIQKDSYDVDRVLKLVEISQKLGDSNSERLNRLRISLSKQLYFLPFDEQERKIQELKNIYESNILPTFAQNYLVFETMNPRFITENKENLENYADYEFNIPSLKSSNIQERKHIIVSDLLRATIESNNLEIKQYLKDIESGNELYLKLKNNEIKFNEMSDVEQQSIKKYSDILNALYNQTSKGRRQPEPRHNSDNVEKDLKELEALFQTSNINTNNLPDRIVRMFGYWIGIRSFEQAKEMVNNVAEKTTQKNKESAKNGIIELREGDFAKGIKLEYFSDMLQNGILAKDYLGKSAKSDLTPGDTDTVLITEENKEYSTLEAKLRNYGTLIIIEKGQDFVKTRQGKEKDLTAVKEVIRDKTKIEYFDNNGKGAEGAYGIRTGVGSSRIKCIVLPEIKTTGFEIAKNGFYIPIVNSEGEVIFTPEMYDELREKMQGLSHYGIDTFKVDKTARNEGTKKIIDYVEASKKDAQHKREEIFKTLKKAIDSMGLEITEKISENMKDGIVEIIDTGSTGRGTNSPGDGDFDFMVRVDKSIFNNESKQDNFKESLRKELKQKEISTETSKGDFRYKGVTIEGISEKIDLDLTFEKRTDELTYTTEQAIKDRLDTIKRQDPEDYKYVVANILLAKKEMKTAGAYKKASAPNPQNGEKDTRGGLGAVGIENWILQNGGSYEKACRTFLEKSKEARESSNGDTKVELSNFKEKYPIWDFGENYLTGKNDNFVENLTDIGYKRMQETCQRYIEEVDKEKETESIEKPQTSISKIVQEDMSVLSDTQYMMSVAAILDKAKKLQRENMQATI